LAQLFFKTILNTQRLAGTDFDVISYLSNGGHGVILRCRLATLLMHGSRAMTAG